jgi:hypothetical protein
MASIDSLPADQRAVLELVLRRGRSYDEIARLLSIDRAGVRQRALAAFDALGPQTGVAPDRRALITDYLLGALPDGVAQDVRQHLGASASERAWARSIASELQGLSDRPLPEIPSNGRMPHSEARAAAKRAAPAAVAVADGSPRDRPPHRPGSRVGGAILLGLAAVVALVLVLVFVVFTGSNAHPRAVAHRGTAAHHGTTTASSSAKVLAQIQLKSPSGATSPAGAAELVRLDGRLGVAIAAEGLAATRKNPPAYYAAWLYNSPSDVSFLGFTGAVTSNGRLETAGAAPSNASHYHEVLLTLETQTHPKTPGHIVLSGTFTAQ